MISSPFSPPSALNKMWVNEKSGDYTRCLFSLAHVVSARELRIRN